MTEALARQSAAGSQTAIGLAARIRRYAGSRTGLAIALGSGALAACALPPFFLRPAAPRQLAITAMAFGRSFWAVPRRFHRFCLRHRAPHRRALLDLAFSADRSMAARLADSAFRRRACCNPRGLQRARGRRRALARRSQATGSAARLRRVLDVRRVAARLGFYRLSVEPAGLGLAMVGSDGATRECDRRLGAFAADLAGTGRSGDFG